MSNIHNSLKASFRFVDLNKTLTSKSLSRPIDVDGVKFGHKFALHMLEIDWRSGLWNSPTIRPLSPLYIHPAAKVLHYAHTIFEGMKAYRGIDDKIRLFRPGMHIDRLRKAAARMDLPDFDPEELLKLICELVKTDKLWVPSTEKSALYIRPLFFGTEPTLGLSRSNEAHLICVNSPVGAYYHTGFQPLALLADPRFVRSYPGGVGEYKCGCNYAPTIYAQKLAIESGCQQTMWLYGRDEKLTEVGVMNVFIYWINELGEIELITPPLSDGLILPGVTRDTLLILAKVWNEFKVTEGYPKMHEIRRAIKEKRLKQMFGTGTAAVVAPINRIRYLNREANQLEDIQIPMMDAAEPDNVMKRFYDTILGIQYGRIEWPGWTRIIE